MGLGKVWPDLENYLRMEWKIISELNGTLKMWVSEKFGLISKIISEGFLMGLKVSFLDNFFCQRVLGPQICRFFSSFGLQEPHFAEFMGTA